MAGQPKVVFQSGRVRFFDGGGGAWTVYDCRRAHGRIRRTAMAVESATWRVFVDPRGGKWAYRFQPGDPRDLEATTLARQLTTARWQGAHKPQRRSRR